MTADTQIRVSDRVKRVLDRRRRRDESYNDVLERVLIDADTDPPIGLNRESGTESDPVSLHRKRAKTKRNAWMRQLPTDDMNTDG